MPIRLQIVATATSKFLPRFVLQGPWDASRSREACGHRADGDPPVSLKGSGKQGFEGEWKAGRGVGNRIRREGSGKQVPKGSRKQGSAREDSVLSMPGRGQLSWLACFLRLSGTILWGVFLLPQKALPRRATSRSACSGRVHVRLHAGLRKACSQAPAAAGLQGRFGFGVGGDLGARPTTGSPLQRWPSW